MTSTRCAACKYFRRRCRPDCIFAPYFPADNPQRFACVHRIYGASNIGKMLEELPVQLRVDAIESLYYEAKCRIQDPVYGCAGIISLLHQEIHIAQSQLAKAQAEIAFLDATTILAKAQAEIAFLDATSVALAKPAPSLGESLVQENGIDRGLDDASNMWFY